MTEQQIIVTLISAMVSGIITSALLFIATTFQRKLQSKRELINNIFAYRYQYLNSENRDVKDFLKEISRIPIVFNDDKKALEALERFYEKGALNETANAEIKREEFVTLMWRLCTSAHFNCKDWNDSRFIRMIPDK